MKKVLAFLLLISGISAAAENVIIPDLAKIKNRKKLVVAIVGQPYEPFFMRDRKGELYGLDIEIAKRVAEDIGVPVEFNQTAKTFDEVIDLVNQKKVDVAISKLTATSKRAQYVLFSKPYYLVHEMILVNRLKNPKLNKDDPKKLFEAVSKKDSSIAIVRGTFYVDKANHDFPLAEKILVDTPEQVFQTVIQGQAKFAMMDEINARNWINNHQEKLIYIANVLIENDQAPIAMAVSSDERDFLDWLNIFIDETDNDGTLAKLKTYYLESFEWKKRL